jgi:hypothetical protein
MSMRSICAQLFFAVLVAVLFALPRAAQAHQGHAHPMHVHSHAHAPAQHADIDKGQHGLAESHAEQSLTAASFSTPLQTHDVPCADPGCCAHGSCFACCSMVAPLVPLILPPTLHTEIDDVANAGHSGVDGPSLRRPPKFFA